MTRKMPATRYGLPRGRGVAPDPFVAAGPVADEERRQAVDGVGLKILAQGQLGDLGVLQGVVRGFSEEARIRGFPSPSFGGFGFVRCD